MASCVLKTCCGCLDLRIGSLILGHILLVLKAIWLFMCGESLYMLIKFFMRASVSTEYKVTIICYLIDELRMAWEFLIILIIIVGLFKKHREYLRPCYHVLATFFVLELAMFIFRTAYFGIHFINILIGIMFACHIITLLITVYFLFVVRSYSLEADDANSSGEVYKSVPKQSKLAI